MFRMNMCYARIDVGASPFKIIALCGRRFRLTAIALCGRADCRGLA